MKKEIYLKNQAKKLTEKQIDRRQFVMGALAAGVALPTALSMASDAIAATPKKGGKLRYGSRHGSTTDSLDPATYENGFTTNTGFAYGNYLTEVKPDGSLVGELAEEFGASDDAKTWTFKLRDGVEFHNGKTLSPADVIASINHHRGEASKSAAKGLLTSVKDIKSDGNAVVFELDAGNADFPFILSDYHLTILAEEGGKIDPTSGVGTGPYKVVSFEPGVRMSAVRNPNYFKSDAAYFDEYEIKSLVDPTARQNALINGEVDAIDGVDPKTVDLLKLTPTLNIVEETGTLHYTFPMRLDVEPFGNLDLRLALKYAIKRQEMVDKILLGHGALGNDHPISTANQFHAGDLPQREFDADKAAFHYKKSGHSGALQLSTSEAAFAGATDAAALIKASAAEAGIAIDIVAEPKDGYWSNVWNKKGWCACYWGGRPTEDWMFASAYVDSTEWNDTAWKTTDAAKQFNKIVVEARAELDQAKRREMYFEAQKLIHEDGGVIAPMFANYIMGLSKKIGHGKMAANWEMDGHKAAERWWFA